MGNGRRGSGVDRRGLADRRISHDLHYFLNGGPERRAWRERRSAAERRKHWVRVSHWTSVAEGAIR